jgi:hypothetical protein
VQDTHETMTVCREGYLFLVKGGCHAAGPLLYLLSDRRYNPEPLKSLGQLFILTGRRLNGN